MTCLYDELFTLYTVQVGYEWYEGTYYFRRGVSGTTSSIACCNFCFFGVAITKTVLVSLFVVDDFFRIGERGGGVVLLVEMASVFFVDMTSVRFVDWSFVDDDDTIFDNESPL